MDNPKDSILITGGSGLLALNWAASMRDSFSVILGMHNRHVKLDGVNCISANFDSENDIISFLNDTQPKLVIHTAGLTSVEKCELNPDLAFKVNVDLSIFIAKASYQLGIPLVHISTDHLFEGYTSMISEKEPTRAINVYGQTKAEAEKTVLLFNPDALIIRTNFYGWGTSYRKSFSDHIINSLRNHQVIYLFDDVHYTPIFVKNLIQTVHALLDKNVKGIFHVASDDRISKYEFGVLIAEEFGLDKSLIHNSTLQTQLNLVKRPLDMSLSNRKVRELLGRNLGTVKQHIALLHQQEIEVETQEIQLL